MMKSIAKALVVILMLIVLAGCSAKNEPGDEDASNDREIDMTEDTLSPATPTESESVVPSDSTPDAPAYAPPRPDRDELIGLWDRIDGSTATIPLTAALYDELYGGNQPPSHSTTPYAYYRLIEKVGADLIFVTYPSESEFEHARMRGVELEIIPVTKDALVFLVNVENPVDNISLPQLRDVYTGEITGWRSLGGANEDIIPFQRPVGSGSQTLFLKLLMNSLTPMEPPSQWVIESMGELVESVSNYDNSRDSIGYSMFYYVNNMYGNSRFKLLGVDGVSPTRETITRGEYPLEDCYYAVMRSDTPEDSPARKLVDWLLGDEGQSLAVRAGYIPIRPIEGVLPDDALDPVYLGDTENSSGTGGTVLKTGIEDAQPSFGVRRPLSDMFFDGFNYINYINNEIIARLDPVDAGGYMLTGGEEYQTRPFSGIPNDYPHYEIYYMGGLIINFPDNNPFFNGMVNFYIRLTEDISPYGVGRNEYSVTYDYGRRMTPRVDLYTLSVDIPDRPDVADRINKQLQIWTDSLPGGGASTELLDGFVNFYRASDGWPYRLQPTAGLWRDYLSVNYYLQTYDGPAFPPRMIFTISFDLRTGEAVGFVDTLPGDLDFSGASVFVPVTFDPLDDWNPLYEYLPEGYIPPRGSVITDAWVGYSLNIYISEPSGRVLQAIFPEDLW